MSGNIAEKTAIELRNISKSFGSVHANRGINLSVGRGEILALLGENGSGKTTLMNMLSGIYQPDDGEIFINGEKVVLHSPEDSKRLGIGMVHQHFKLVEKFSASDNILIGSESEEGADKFFLRRKRYERIKRVGEAFGFDVDPKKKVCDMSVSEKQTVEILKVLYYGADILILDEPTAVLTLQETRKLFSVLRKMRDSGCAIIIITHKLNEVLEISDRVTILRKGESIGTVVTAETDARQLTDMMVGRSVELAIDRPAVEKKTELLSIEGLTVRGESGANAIEDVSLKLYGGQILGIAGVSGCGQKELCEAIAGLQKIQSGTIKYKGTNIEGKSPREIINLGISMSFIPEDRLGMGLAASLGITDNMMLKSYRNTKGPFVDRKSARRTAAKVIRDLDISTPGTEVPVRRLSGGNVQKVLVGREIESSPNIIVTAYPVRGLDINSSYTIYDILNAQKTQGTAIMFVGEDLDVMLELCDEILVLCHGRVTGLVKASETSKEELGLLMTNANADDRNKAEATESEKEQSEPAPSVPVMLANNRTKKKVKKKEPLIHLVKRDAPTLGRSAFTYFSAIVIALLLGGLIILANKVNPLSYYYNIVTGCFKNVINMRGLIRLIAPLLITSLGISLAFKMKFWNIGAEGQFIGGAIFAVTAATLLKNAGLPNFAMLAVMILAAAIGGGLVGLVPAFFKVRFGTNETLLTLMMNYIMLYILSFLKKTYMFGQLNPQGELNNRDFATLVKSAWMPELKVGKLRVDISVFFAIALVLIVYLYSKKTKHGYEISIVGDSAGTAKYAGMSVPKIVLRTMFLSAALVGIAGMMQVSSQHRMSDSITSGVGWTGIIVAWLSKLHPIAILVTSVLMCILSKGSNVAESSFNIAPAVSDILQSVILFSVLAADFFNNYKVEFNIGKNKVSNSASNKGKEGKQ